MNKPSKKCPDCGVRIGEEHWDICDVAECWANGEQRFACAAGLFGLNRDGHTDHGRAVWTGLWPGLAECIEFGWPTGDGVPDFDRLKVEAVWDPNAHRYRLREPV